MLTVSELALFIGGAAVVAVILAVIAVDTAEERRTERLCKRIFDQGRPVRTKKVRAKRREGEHKRTSGQDSKQEARKPEDLTGTEQ